MKRQRNVKTTVLRKKNPTTPYPKPYYKKARYAMYRSPRMWMPQEYVTDLTYTSLGVLLFTGVQNTNQVFSTDAYDVDQALGSTAMPGFTEMSAIYAKFRTLRFSYNIEYVNQELFPVMVLAGYYNTPPPGLIDQDFAGNPLWKSTMLSSAQGGPCNKTLKDSKAVSQILGTQTYLYDDLYSGSTTAKSVTNPQYIVSAVASPATGTTAGVVVRNSITLKVQFYRMRTLDV